mgnify:CR=1 FL=1
MISKAMTRAAAIFGLCLFVAGVALCASHVDRPFDEDATAAASHGFGCGVALTVVALGTSLSFPPLTGRLASGGSPLQLMGRSVLPFQPPERLA